MKVLRALVLVLAGGVRLVACSNPTPVGSDAGADVAVTDGAAPTDAGDSVDVVTSCTVPTVALDAGFNLATDIPYNTLGGAANTLDVAWPLDGGVHPMVLLVHGGGFIAGDKTEDLPYMAMLASLGYIAASTNYRLDTDASAGFPMQVEDVRCAARYLRKHATDWNGDPMRFGAVGTSAGGYHADMLALAQQADSGLDGPCPSSDTPVLVTAAVAFFGPADLRSLDNFGDEVAAPVVAQQAITFFLGEVPDANPALASTASPVTWVSQTSPPYLLAQGTRDQVVLPVNSVELWSDLRASGVPATLIEIDAGHGFPLLSKAPELQITTCTTLEFLRERLQP